MRKKTPKHYYERPRDTAQARAWLDETRITGVEMTRADPARQSEIRKFAWCYVRDPQSDSWVVDSFLRSYTRLKEIDDVVDALKGLAENGD